MVDVFGLSLVFVDILDIGPFFGHECAATGRPERLFVKFNRGVIFFAPLTTSWAFFARFESEI
jgi:hypothetical protein